jgi:hypothetical protein
MAGSAAPPQRAKNLLAEQGKGILRSCFTKPFPIRAAFELGTQGALNCVVARMDAKQNAVQDKVYSIQLPLLLQTNSATGRLTKDSKADIFRNMEAVMCEIQKRRIGVSEFAGLLTWPFPLLSNLNELQLELTKQFQVQFVTPQELQSTVPGGTKRAKRKGLQKPIAEAERGTPYSDEEILERLSLDSYAAASRSLNKYNLIVLSESFAPSTPASASVEFLSLEENVASTQLDTEGKRQRGAEYSTKKWESSLHSPGRDSMLKFTLPFGTYHVHRLLLTEIQRRNPSQYTTRSSPNPVLGHEFVACREALYKMIEDVLPAWVKEKSKQGCQFACAGPNGGLFNVAARVCGKEQMSLTHLEVKGQYHYSGLTDVLIGENYPNPHLVIPQTILACSLMRAMSTMRMSYCPDVNLAYGLLVHPGLWQFRRQDGLEKELQEEKAWYLHQRWNNEPQQSRDRFSPNNWQVTPPTISGPPRLPDNVPEFDVEPGTR